MATARAVARFVGRPMRESLVPQAGLANVEASAFAASRRHRSVVGQSIHGSVIDTPYLSAARFELSGWLPASILLSSIAPMIAPLPAHTWSTKVCSTSGCLVKSLLD